MIDCQCNERAMGKEVFWICKNVPAYAEACLEKNQEKIDRVIEEIRAYQLLLPEEFRYSTTKINEEELPDEVVADHFIIEMEKRGIDAGRMDERSKGLGDTIERVLGKLGVSGSRFERLFGIGGCGCDKRKQFLNKIFPYFKK